MIENIYISRHPYFPRELTRIDVEFSCSNCKRKIFYRKHIENNKLFENFQENNRIKKFLSNNIKTKCVMCNSKILLSKDILMNKNYRKFEEY